MSERQLPDSALAADGEVEDTLSALYAAIEERDGCWQAQHRGLTLSSSFQPVFSFPHAKPVGFEALVRVQDANGRPVSPLQLFDCVDDFAEQVWLDRVCRLLHVHNFCLQSSADAWLFLNMHPAVFLHTTQNRPLMLRAVDLLCQLGIPMHRLVIEVTEDALAHDASFEAAAAHARSLGCLLALDDFGAGHSNFDRVWRIRPEIVKLDRSLVQRALKSQRVARMLAQVVGLLHECGSLALLEGVETDDEAQLALDADVDLVQGFAFAHPQPQLLGMGVCAKIEQVWQQFDQRTRRLRLSYQERVAPFQTALALALLPLQQGQPLAQAAHAFLSLPTCLMVYRLDEAGRDVEVQLGQRVLDTAAQRFAPLERAGDARWARRPYFRRAMEKMGEVQVTRPYLSLHGARLCVTVSVAFWHLGQLQVLCGDVDWSDQDAEA
jgi:EAL domain-containing protein (putative c-di-GMP-specific phosphodiesterase class I)